jgi:[acyl-carrier-protein] S-malonyltransferase
MRIPLSRTGFSVIRDGTGTRRSFPNRTRDICRRDQLLDYPLSRIAWEGPEQELNDTVNTQPALFVHSIAALRVFQNIHPGFRPAFIAGHSMGELSALVAAQALTFEDGLSLVRIRGESMKQAGEISPGGMAAILGLDIATLEHICQQASDSYDVVQVANDNCPGASCDLWCIARFTARDDPGREIRGA